MPHAGLHAAGLHLLGFANMLRRPVMLMGARRHVEMRRMDCRASGCLTYLPIRHPPSDLATTVPVLVAWGNEGGPALGAGHFVCVVPTQGSPDVIIPQELCPALHSSCLEVAVDRLGHYLHLAPPAVAQEASADIHRSGAPGAIEADAGVRPPGVRVPAACVGGAIMAWPAMKDGRADPSGETLVVPDLDGRGAIVEHLDHYKEGTETSTGEDLGKGKQIF